MDSSRQIEIDQLLENLGYWYDSAENRFEPIDGTADADHVNHDPDSFLAILGGRVTPDELGKYMQFKTVQQDTEVDGFDSPPVQRPWAISRRYLILSLALAGVVELAFLAALVIALISGNRNPAVIVLPLFWPLFYAFELACSYGIAFVDQKGPASERFPRWYRNLFPAVVFRKMDRAYSRMPNTVLLIGPVFMVLMSVAVLWAACTGKLNP